MWLIERTSTIIFYAHNGQRKVNNKAMREGRIPGTGGKCPA